MKTKTLTFAVALSALAFTLSAQAHDPKEHMKVAEKPDCAAMKNMDHKNMDMNDPVMQAMMQQCMKEMNHAEKPENAVPEQGEHNGHGLDDKPVKHGH